MRLVNICSQCNRPLELYKSFPLSFSNGTQQALQTYTCGHSFVEDVQPQVDNNALVLANVYGTKKARNYQVKGVDFIVNANGGFNCILADQMRIGKTPQSLMALATGFRMGRVRKALILVKSANLWQWIGEYKDWCNVLPLGIYPIIGTKSFIPPGFSTYIMSMDTFSRKGMVDTLLTMDIDVVIVDEAHSFKNPDSNRSKALIQFLHQVNREEITHTIPFICSMCKHQWDEEVTVTVDHTSGNKRVSKTSYCPSCNAQNIHSAYKENIKKERKGGCVLLSGTLVINRATEYYVPLNIVAPEVFPSYASFVRTWIDADGKHIKSWKLDEFRALIAQFVLRREKEDVYTDLPPISRYFTLIKVEDENLKELYNKTLDKMEENMQRTKSGGFHLFDNIGELSRLRQICGLAKIDWTLDYLRELRENYPGKKMCIGVHHHSVRDQLFAALGGGANCWKLDGEDSAEQKFYVQEQFRNAPAENLIVGMGAGKEGVELVYLEDELVLERAWSSQYEEQFEFRIYNPDKDLLESKGLSRDKKSVIQYVVAQGTVDEFFYNIVEEKRKIFGETVANNWDLTTDEGSFRELCERTVAGRL